MKKSIPRLKNSPDEDKLLDVNLISLSKRILQRDLIEVFKIFKGFDNINAEDYFTVDRSNITRKRNSFKIVGKRFLSNEAKHFFFNRVVNVWNYLPSKVVDSTSVTAFKNRLDKYLDSNPQLKYYSLT